MSNMLENTRNAMILFNTDIIDFNETAEEYCRCVNTDMFLGDDFDKKMKKLDEVILSQIRKIERKKKRRCLGGGMTKIEKNEKLQDIMKNILRSYYIDSANLSDKKEKLCIAEKYDLPTISCTSLLNEAYHLIPKRDSRILESLRNDNKEIIYLQTLRKELKKNGKPFKSRTVNFSRSSEHSDPALLAVIYISTLDDMINRRLSCIIENIVTAFPLIEKISSAQARMILRAYYLFPLKEDGTIKEISDISKELDIGEKTVSTAIRSGKEEFIKLYDRFIKDNEAVCERR